MLRCWLACTCILALTGCDRSARDASSVPKTDTTGAARLQPVTLALNWRPEAEHGGFYAALVHGYYREAGLDVTILPGGPNSPVAQRVATGDVMFGVSNADNVLFTRAQEAPVVAVMAPMQTSPRCLMVHESSGIKTFPDLKDMTIAMNASLAFAQFLIKKYPLENVQVVPYSGTVSQFLLDKNFAQQGYVFSEPFVAEKQGGDPRVLMLSDLGFNPYTSLLITSEQLIADRPELVGKMVTASVRGWGKYLEASGETNQRIHDENPEMDLDILAFGAKEIKPLVLTDEAQQHGIGTMSLARWQTLFEQLVETEQLKPGSVDPRKAFDVRFLTNGH